MKTSLAFAGARRAPLLVVLYLTLVTGSAHLLATAKSETPTRRAEAATATSGTQAWRLNDLINRPERWPPAVKLLRDVSFQSGSRFPAGTTLRVTKVTPREVEVLLPDGGRADFAPADTDLVVAANAHWAGLTPEQRRLDYAAVVRDATLQPPVVTTYVSLNFPREKIGAGSEVPLVEVTRQGAVFWGKVDRRLMTIAPQETDVLVRARAIAARSPAERPDRFLPLLAGTVVDRAGQRTEVAPARYYVFYRSSSTCPNSVNYTPRFSERMSRILERHPHVRLLSLSNDATPAAMLEFARQHRVPGHFVASTDLHPAFFRYQAQVMPALVVVDPLGREIMAQRRYTGPASLDLVLDRLEAELAKVSATP